MNNKWIYLLEYKLHKDRDSILLMLDFWCFQSFWCVEGKKKIKRVETKDFQIREFEGGLVSFSK